MNKIEELAHLLSVFRQASNNEPLKLSVVANIRDIALDYINPIKSKITRPLPESVRAAYEAKGVSLEWDLNNTADIAEFYYLAKEAEISATHLSAAQLLYACDQTLREGTVTDLAKDWILSGYVGLEAENAKIGSSFNKRGVTAAQTDYIRNLAREYQNLSAKELFPKADKAIIGNMKESTFMNQMTKARKFYPKKKCANKSK